MADEHSIVTTVKDVVSIIGVLAGGAYFAWRVFFQRTFQRLSVEADLTLLTASQSLGPSRAIVSCSIENKGQARIDLEWLKFQFGDGSPEQGKPFEPNTHRNDGKAYSIDAQSRVEFYAEADVPDGGRPIVLVVALRPKSSGETYCARKVVIFDQQAGQHQAPAPVLATAAEIAEAVWTWPKRTLTSSSDPSASAIAGKRGHH